PADLPALHLSLHDALPILILSTEAVPKGLADEQGSSGVEMARQGEVVLHFIEIGCIDNGNGVLLGINGFLLQGGEQFTESHGGGDRKSTRLNSSHVKISYA